MPEIGSTEMLRRIQLLTVGALLGASIVSALSSFDPRFALIFKIGLALLFICEVAFDVLANRER